MSLSVETPGKGTGEITAHHYREEELSIYTFLILISAKMRPHLVLALVLSLSTVPSTQSYSRSLGKHLKTMDRFLPPSPPHPFFFFLSF